MIMNTDRSNKEGEHWWSLLEISSKQQIFLFDSFAFVGHKEFIIDNDKQIIDQFFYGLEKINKKDKIINLTYVHFDNESYKKVNKDSLRPTAREFFHSLSQFSKVHNENAVDVFMVDDQLQNIKSDTCGLFQLYFYMNLILPKESSKIVGNRTLNLRTKKNLLNEIFSKDILQNEIKVENFAAEHNIKRE